MVFFVCFFVFLWVFFFPLPGVEGRESVLLANVDTEKIILVRIRVRFSDVTVVDSGTHGLVTFCLCYADVL